VESFIDDLNSGCSAITIPLLDSSGMISFSCCGMTIRLEVRESNNKIVQTCFEHNNKAAAAGGRPGRQVRHVPANIGTGGKLTFRYMNQKHVFKAHDENGSLKVSKNRAAERF